jgi:hypothetical protein
LSKNRVKPRVSIARLIQLLQWVRSQSAWHEWQF